MRTPAAADSGPARWQRPRKATRLNRDIPGVRMADSKKGMMDLMPGMDFMQNLWKAAPGIAQTLPPSLTQWIAPTTSIEEVSKKIADLQAVQAWLETNANMVKATIQALEVQRMTLSTLKSMKVNIDDVAQALAGKKEPAQAKALDPMQWWGALSKQITQPFVQLAGDSLKQSAKGAAQKTAGSVASSAAGLAMDAAFAAASKSLKAAQKTAATAGKVASSLARPPARKPAAGRKSAAPRKRAAR
jgi:hypothetical protein